jgi:hypothetical protein
MLAAMSTRQDLHPAKLRASDVHRKALLEHISAAGITRYWSEILDVEK